MTGHAPSFMPKTQFNLLLPKGQPMPPIPAKKSVTYSDPKHAPALKADDSIELSFRNAVLL
ncbi:MAG: hypothetical protein LZF63_11940 [Nitrosomonas sp.]|nr:hypothetical protein [Nitrosomonas sp.]